MILRWAWRYRSELAPLYLAGAILGASWWLHAAHPHWWPYHRRHRRRSRAALAAFGGRDRPPDADGAPVRGHDHARGRRMASRRDRRWARSSRRCRRLLAIGRTGPVGAVVGAPAPPRQGPRRAQARSLARDRPGRRPGRITGHVRRGRRVGMAGPVPPGPRPDHRRRDRQDSRHRVRPGHLPRSRARLPDSRRPGQPVRAAGAGHGPARRRHPLARPVGHLDHRADRPRPVRGRHPVPGPVPAPARPVRRSHRRRARAAGSTCSWAIWPPAATW